MMMRALVIEESQSHSSPVVNPEAHKLCTSCENAVDNHTDSGDYKEILWTGLGIQKYLLTCGFASVTLPYVR
jgi:hypothetical protein